MAGSRGGLSANDGEAAELTSLSPEVATKFIAIEGAAEVRIRATKLRVVLAVSGEGETAAACKAAVNKIVQDAVQAWKAIGVADEAIHEDFIAILPQYQWRIEKQESQEVAVERLMGYRMQVNLHVASNGEPQAQSIIDESFKLGITDIIAFDYWHPELDRLKQEAMAKAVEAAKQKSSVLLKAVFENPPKPINVQEKTVVHFPATMYESFDNAYRESIDLPSRRNLPSISAFRPKNTYYRGLRSGADVTPDEMAFRPEITIVSRVKIYFQSPSE